MESRFTTELAGELCVAGAGAVSGGGQTLSLQSARILAQIHRQFGKHIPIFRMFEQPTMGEFVVTFRGVSDAPQVERQEE